MEHSGRIRLALKSQDEKDKNYKWYLASLLTIPIALSPHTLTSPCQLTAFEMRLSIASVVSLVIAPTLAGCPYARDLGLNIDDHESPHTHLPRDIASKSSAAPIASPTTVAGKKGVFYSKYL